jgi:Arc/MetJ family transcription regulator
MHGLLTNSQVSEEARMRFTIDIDEQLIAKARWITGMRDRTALVREGLRADRTRE